MLIVVNTLIWYWTPSLWPVAAGMEEEEWNGLVFAQTEHK
jgi:hypothetical protein